MVRDALREMAIRGCGAEEAVEGRREGWSGGAVRSHCAGVSTDLVGQNDCDVELEGEDAVVGGWRVGRSGTWAHGTRWACGDAVRARGARKPSLN